MLGGCPAAFLFRLAFVSRRPPYRQILGEKIRACRKQAGFTQEKLAEKADLHHNFVGEVERGNLDISVGSLRKLAAALGIRVRDLVEDL